MTNQLGYYTVGSEIFYSKTRALIRATQVNQHPTWNFGDVVFGSLPWTQGTVDNIRNVYRARAQQLRDKYDYLVLSYSGGSDSWTVLNSFLQQGIAPDELLIRWPIKSLQDKYTISTYGSDTNILSEWDLVIKPDLEYLAVHHPNIKITVYDWSDDLDVELVEDDWMGINDHLNPGVFRKYSAWVGTETEQRMIDAGKTVATIWGIDKPQIVYRDSNVHFYFLDKLANTKFVSGVQNRVAEMFYWSVDMPEIVHQQARLMYEYFVSHPEHLYLVDWNRRTSRTPEQKKLYDHIIKSVVYPDWNPAKFQANKSLSMVKSGIDHWMFQHYNNYRYLQSWEHGISSIKQAVDKKYYQFNANGDFIGWTGFISPFYCLGAIHVDNMSGFVVQ